MRRVLGIDSAFSRTGWALVERDGARERLVAHGVLEAVDAEVVTEFSGKMATQGLTIDVVAIEDVYLDKNVDTVKALSRLVGRWQQAFEAMGLTTSLVMGDVWQRSVLTGLMNRSTKRDGRKKAAQLWAKATFREALSMDEADAVGIATFELRQRSFADRCAG